MKKIILLILFPFYFTDCSAQSWNKVGQGFNAIVYDLLQFQDKLYAGGKMGVEYWNDTSWTSLSWGQKPLTLQDYQDTLYIGGDFTSTNSISKVQKFNGSSWIQAGGDFWEPSWSSTKKLLVYNGQLISGGRYTHVDGKNIKNIARYNGTSWDSLGAGLNGTVWNLAEHNGKLFATGEFTASGNDTSIKYRALWDGIKWSPLNTTPILKTGNVMISFDSMLFIGNCIDTIAGIPMHGITAWDGNNFHARGDSLIRSIVNFSIYNNELYLSGQVYTQNPNVYANAVLKWNGTNWQQIGDNFDDIVVTIAEYKNQLFCAGRFASCGSSTTPSVAKLDMATTIQEKTKFTNFSLYPNPASNTTSIKTNERGELFIFDILGRHLQTLPIKENETQITLKNLPKGLLQIILRTKDNKSTSAILIKN